MRKRLGVILAQPEEHMQRNFMSSFMEEAYKKDFDLCVFSMYQKYQQTDMRNVGDSNIYSLIRYESFAGFVVLLDTLQTPGLDQKILRSLKENFHGPVIIADKENEFYDYILMDHYTPMKALVNHLIVEHGYRRIAFLGGKEGHPHSLQRLNGFRDAMNEHGIPIREDWIAHGDYWYDSGKEFAGFLLSHRDDMPEAVACANDYMAIGLASVLSENGLEIPKDIAVIGYDSTEEGRTSPFPLTSAKIPSGECGRECFEHLYAAITNTSAPKHELKPELIIGGSCGCKNFEPAYKKIYRDEWKTDRSSASFYSDFNHITEDMLCQTDYEKFFRVLASYSYQVRPFKKLWLCFNNNFLNPAEFIGENARRKGYSDRMHMVVQVGDTPADDDPEAVDLNRSFSTSVMIPDLDVEKDYPTTYIFTPLFFEDISFGYAVMNVGAENHLYNITYRVWMRNINLGIRAFYQQKTLVQLISKIKSDQIRDAQTGLYNYRGFHISLKRMCERNIGSHKTLSIFAFDANQLKEVNEAYGRESGDMAIRALASFISRCTLQDEICCRLSNDEFLIGIINDDCDLRVSQIEESIPKEGLLFYDSTGNPHNIQLHYDMIETTLGEMPDLDFLINLTVNAKNNKKKEQRKKEAIGDFSEELLAKCNEVEKILKEGLITYAFQPIVSSRTGEIYGYEALMRSTGEMHITPQEILKCAEHINKLYDIEKTTFHGVLNHMENINDALRGKKIFINSLPAHQLEGADEEELFARLRMHPDRIVIEFTEGSELDDEILTKREEDCERLGLEIALDDYGSGYSNVNNLLRYNPRYVKIDYMLISGIDSNARKRHFVQSIIGYANQNNIAVLAEGVETMAELRTVIGLGVDYIQGFYTGRPDLVPVAEIDPEIRSQIRRFSANRDKQNFLIS
ncbi:MAG: EAL domain-containing protein [Lachnospiraceae bacterium]|nr:EAL domain-containing protein [Lachnospiraceae bacterium]